MRLRAVAANLKAWGDCLIVDDNAAFLEAATTLLERDGMNVVGTASTIADALREVQDVRPDVVLVDISLGTESLRPRTALAEVDGGEAVILISTRDAEDLDELIAAARLLGALDPLLEPKPLLVARDVEEDLDQRVPSSVSSRSNSRI